MTDPVEDEERRFRREVEGNVEAQRRDRRARELSAAWLARTHELRYDYNFRWLGLPVLQLPQDLVAIQEIVWETRPEVIVETGVARGGSLVFHASLLELLGGDRRVVGIEIDLRAHARRALERHPLRRRITVLEGSSTDPDVAAEVRRIVAGKAVMVVLDADHRHAAVLRELELYAPLVPVGGYVVVCDTIVDDLGPRACPDRPWGPGDNPRTAVREFLRSDRRFVADENVTAKLLLSNSPGGYLKRVR